MKDCFEICDDHPGSRPIFARSVLVDSEVTLVVDLLAHTEHAPPRRSIV